MSEYEVIYEGTVREIYIVEAESAEEARERWADHEPVSSETTDGAVVDVRVSDDA